MFRSFVRCGIDMFGGFGCRAIILTIFSVRARLSEAEGKSHGEKNGDTSERSDLYFHKP